MDPRALHQLVEQLVRQALSERGETPAPEPRPLVLMTGECREAEVIFHQLERLERAFGPCTAALSESFCECHPPEAFTRATAIGQTVTRATRAEVGALVGGASLLLVGALSCNSLAKFAAGICDSLPSVLYAAARTAHLPLFIAEGPAALATPSAPALPPARLRQREEQLSMLRADGAQLVAPPEIFERVQRFLLERGDPVAAKRQREAGPRAIITAEDVERAHRRGMTEWALPADAIVTMAAHDRARDLGLRLSGGNLP